MYAMRHLRVLLLASFLFAASARGPNSARGEEAVAPVSHVSPVLGPFIEIWSDTKPNTNQAVAYNSDLDEYLSVWTTKQDSFTTDIWGRRVYRDGTTSPAFCIATSAGEALLYADAAYSTRSHHYIVVYEDPYNSAPDDMDIWGVIFAGDGTGFIGPFQVDFSPNDQAQPAVTYNETDDEFLVVYNHLYSSFCVEVKARRINASNGSQIGEIKDIRSSPACDDYFNSPDVAFNPIQNSYLFNYIYSRWSTNQDSMSARLASSDLQALGAEYQLTGDGIFTVVSVAAGLDEYLAATESQAGSDLLAYARRIRSDGVPLGPSAGFPVSTPAVEGDPGRVQVAATRQGYWVTWTSYTEIAQMQNIYGNFVPMGADHALLSREFKIEEFGSVPYHEKIACSWLGKCLVTDHYRPAGTGQDYEIRGRFLYPYGIYLPVVRR